jgi:hypothetical protein
MFFLANSAYFSLSLGQKRRLFPVYKSFPTKHNIAHNIMLTWFVINHLLQITIVVLESENIPPIPHLHNLYFIHAPLEI